MCFLLRVFTCDMCITITCLDLLTAEYTSFAFCSASTWSTICIVPLQVLGVMCFKKLLPMNTVLMVLLIKKSVSLPWEFLWVNLVFLDLSDLLDLLVLVHMTMWTLIVSSLLIKYSIEVCWIINLSIDGSLELSPLQNCNHPQ